MARLKEKYTNEIVPSLRETFHYKNVMEVPRIDKVVINMGIGEASQNANLLDSAVSELTTITGQKAVVTRAKKSISNFKLREGIPVGCRVTLRGNRMYEFLDRLINLAIPRIRDFRGVPTRSFDGRGNYTLGLAEQTIFPEIEYDRIDQLRGMDVTIVTSAQTDEESAELLKQFGMPFRRA
jgi:large subunit ribosomal protein L5